MSAHRLAAFDNPHEFLGDRWPSETLRTVIGRDIPCFYDKVGKSAEGVDAISFGIDVRLLRRNSKRTRQQRLSTDTVDPREMTESDNAHKSNKRGQIE
jgi:hypothetical protein